MVSAGDFKNGITLEMDGNIWQIIEFQHVKPGKGAAFVRTKLKNIKSGGVIEKSFRPTEKFPLAHIDKSEYQYLYSDGDFYVFMNTETFEQINLTQDNVGDALKFVKLQRQNLALRVIQQQALLSLLLLKQVLRLWFRFSLTLVIRLRLIHVLVNIFQELNLISIPGYALHNPVLF